MNLKLFSKAVIFTFCCSITFSCSETIDQNQPPLSLGKLDLSELSIKLNPVTIDLNEYPLDQLLKDVGEELYQIDIHGVEQRMKLTSLELAVVGVRIQVDGEKNEALLTPIEFSESKNENYRIATEDDNALCRGQPGEGWTSYSNCTGHECVQEMMMAAADDLGEPGVGECLDLRVVRTLLSARVCGRLVDC